MTSAQIVPANLSALGRKPDVADAVVEVQPPESGDLWEASDGAITARLSGVTLHHAEQPLRDSRRWAAEAVERIEAAGATRVIVVGFALGHHIEALAHSFDGEITVLEPDPSLLRLALSTRDVSELLERVDLQIGTTPVDADGAYVLTYAPLRLLGGERYAEAVRNCGLAAARGVGRLKVLVVTPMYGGSHPIALHAHRALGRLGHEAEILDLAEFFPSFEKLALFGARPSRRRGTEGLFADMLGDGVAARVEEGGFDLVLALAQAPLGAKALDAIRRAGALRALWFVEDRKVFPYWREVAPHYDHVFVIQKDDCIAEMRAAGVRDVSYLPCAAAPEIHRPLSLTQGERAAFGSAVSFVGAGYRNRRHAFQRFLDMDFRVWGSEWVGAPGLSEVLERGGARISTEDSVRIWNASSVNLNLHSSTYCDDVDPRGDFVNPRTFEIASCGAFQIVDHRALLPESFDLGGEIVAVDCVADMKEAARHYLARPDERDAIAHAGRERVLREHTYERRMETLIAWIVSRHADRFARRQRSWTVKDARREATGPLADYLKDYPDEVPFTLDEMVRRIPEAEGPLTEPEALFLFLSQFDDMYLSEYRR